MNMKSFFIATLFIVLCTSVSAQQYRSDVKIDGLRGNVNVVDQTLYEAKVYDGQMQRGEVLEHIQTLYTSRGYRKSMTYLSTAEDIIFRTRYKHDGFGLVTLEHIVDPAENIISRTYYIYDQNNILTESYVEDAERQTESRIRYKYNGNGQVSQLSFNDPFNNIYKREVYTYAPNGEIRIAVVYDSENHKVFERRYEYDEHNQPVSYTLYDYTEVEPEVFITLYRYRYDDQGNWVQRTEYTLEGDKATPNYIVERKLTYF